MELNYLTLLDLSDNPLVLVELSLNQMMKRLKLLKIEFVHFSHSSNIKFLSTGLNTFDVHVTDSILCCLVSQNIKCRSANAHIDCDNLVKVQFKWCFYCLVDCAMMVSLITFMIHIALFSRNSEVLAKNYLMAKTNIFFANLICSVNLVCLVIADVMHIDTIWFRKGPLCIMINATTFVAFEGCSVCKTYHVISVVLKIIFPFNHQCVTLNYS